METVATLLGRINGVAGKTYLFAGLLPAAIFFLGWNWHAHGAAGMVQVFADFRHEGVEASESKSDSGLKPQPAEIAGVALFRAFFVLLVGLIFFGARQLVLQWTADLRGISFLRRMLITRQDRRRRRAERRERDALDKLDLVRWPIGRYDRLSPALRPAATSFSQSVGGSAAVELSKTARDAIERAAEARDRVASDAQIKLVLRGLAALQTQALAKDKTEEIASEFAQWNSMLASSGPFKVLRDIELRLDRRSRDENARHASPDLRFLAPTDLGNQLEILEDYAQTRYGITTSTLWSRLLPLISDDARQEVGDAQTAIYAALNTSASFILLSLVLLAPNIRFAGRPFLFMRTMFTMPDCPFSASGRHQLSLTCGVISAREILFCTVPLLFAYAAYRSAVFSVEAYVERVTRAVDLNRLKIFPAMGLASPRTMLQERERLGRLDRFLGGGELLPEDWELTPPITAETSEGAKKSSSGDAPKPTEST